MAPIRCSTTRTIYHPTPKIASGTLREVFFEIENGFKFRPFTINGRDIKLFQLYDHGELFKPVERPPGYESFAVVREPIKRFLSFYKWGVIDNNCGFSQHIEINDFVDRFEELMTVTPKVQFHLQPQFRFIGRDLGYYTRIFKAEDVPELEAYLSARAGRPISFPQVNKSSRKIEPDVLSPRAITRLRDIYRKDYALLEDVYPLD